MLPLEQATGGVFPPGSHNCSGERESSKTITAPAAWGTTPKNPADSYSSVVPVLEAIGRHQPSALADTAAVPSMTSRLRPVSSVLASPGSSACSHGSSVSGTGFPEESVTSSIGLGGHQVPELSRVAPTLASSR